ncbi:MAG: cytochrome c3 family protein [Pseudomonadota bacterium]|jgi:hypothetical protein
MRILCCAMVIAALSVSAAAAEDTSTCITCHRALDRNSSELVDQFEHDLHKYAGISCHDCHGGDPGSLESAMSASAGFVGAPEGRDSVRLCGGCHSDSGQIPDPTLVTDQMSQYLAGPHGKKAVDERPTCVTCHGSHGISRVAAPSSPVFKPRIADLCLACHGKGTDSGPAGPWRYSSDIHGRAIEQAANPQAPTCINCHGAHKADVPSPSDVSAICGNCHTMEYEYFQNGPHGASLQAAGEPSCTHCHGYHGVEAIGIQEIVGLVTDNCGQCHQVGGKAWYLGRGIDESLGGALSLHASLQNMSEDLRLSGIETGEMDRLNQEAYGWLLQVESAIHSVTNDWEELTGMAKVKMMASWDLARDYNLQKGLRKIILLVVALLAASIFALLAFKLKLMEWDRQRRRVLGSPEARQREQEPHHK